MLHERDSEKEQAGHLMRELRGLHRGVQQRLAKEKDSFISVSETVVLPKENRINYMTKETIKT
jgi:hypothetical protein